MEGKVAIITGSNSGIGKETAFGLARQDYTVIMGCRNLKRGREACTEIKTKSGNEKIFVYELDLCSFDSIKNFIDVFKKNHRKINLLVNNAGISTLKYAITRNGYESTVQTNLIGPYLLITALSDYFEPEADNRIVNLSSDFYKFGKFRIKRINKYHWFKAYAVSKYAVLLLTLELAGDLQHKGITINAVHPGVVRTKIMLTGKWYDAVINQILSRFYINPQEGAKTSIYVSSSAELKGKTGGYYIKNRKIRIPKGYNNRKLRKELLKYCEEAHRKYQGEYDKN